MQSLLTNFLTIVNRVCLVRWLASKKKLSRLEELGDPALVSPARSGSMGVTLYERKSQPACKMREIYTHGNPRAKIFCNNMLSVTENRTLGANHTSFVK